jgi:hemin uptake protein HemP
MRQLHPHHALDPPGRRRRREPAQRVTEDPACGGEPPEDPPAPPLTLTSAELLRGGRELTILHAGEAYRLRLTSRDRLILTK